MSKKPPTPEWTSWPKDAAALKLQTQTTSSPLKKTAIRTRPPLGNKGRPRNRPAAKLYLSGCIPTAARIQTYSCPDTGNDLPGYKLAAGQLKEHRSSTDWNKTGNKGK